MERLGCCDNSCKLEPPETGTNGGCTCLDGLSTEKRIRVEKYIIKLKEQNQELLTTLRDIIYSGENITTISNKLDEGLIVLGKYDQTKKEEIEKEDNYYPTGKCHYCEYFEAEEGTNGGYPETLKRCKKGNPMFAFYRPYFTRSSECTIFKRRNKE